MELLALVPEDNVADDARNDDEDEEQRDERRETTTGTVSSERVFAGVRGFLDGRNQRETDHDDNHRRQEASDREFGTVVVTDGLVCLGHEVICHPILRMTRDLI